MATKNVENVHFWQVNHKIKNILEVEGVTVLPSPKAWQELKWTRKFFEKEPKEGYFVWVRKQIDFPLTTCISIASPRIFQNLTNLLVIEKGIKTRANVLCNATKNQLCGTHKARGRLILKENSYLEYNHLHRWGKKDLVSPDYEFILKENSHLIYNYKNLFPPKILNLKTTIYNDRESSSNLNFIISALNSKIELKDTVFLRGKNSRGIIKLRLVGKQNSQIKAQTSIFARAPGRGHLDCQGLLIDKRSKISLIPELFCEHKEAQITHEASIGKIADEALEYLRMRGLTEKEAIDLMVSGFLKT